LAAVAATALFVGAAEAQTNSIGVYGRVDLGVGVAGDVEFNGSVTGTGETLPFNQSTDLEVGWQAGAAIGLENFPLQNWRLEAEGLYLNQETDDERDNFDDILDIGDNDDDTESADLNIYGGFLNLIYDFPGFQGPFGNQQNVWRPYIGAGAGYGKVEVEYDDAEADDEVFMWQAKAGLSYEITPQTVFEIGYRYLSAESADVDTDDVDLDVSGEVDIESHAVTAGLRWRFGGGYY
jgi:opacity protein-like surface antigen